MREASKKLRALQFTFGKSWQEVAQDWAGRPYSQREVAERWTAAVQEHAPRVRFNQMDVNRIFLEAGCRTRPQREVVAG